MPPYSLCAEETAAMNVVSLSYYCLPLMVAVIGFCLMVPHPSLIVPGPYSQIGVTYNTSLPHQPAAIASAVRDLKFGAVHLSDPHPDLVGAFASQGTSILLSIPNHHLPALASNRSYAVDWLRPRLKSYHSSRSLLMISVGNDVSQQSAFLLPAMQNVRWALEQDLGIHDVPVSTTFSSDKLVNTDVRPSVATFREPTAILPLLKLLKETKFPLLVTLKPYEYYRDAGYIFPVFAAFGHHNFGFRDAGGARYRNLFDMMGDPVFASMAGTGKSRWWWPPPGGLAPAETTWGRIAKQISPTPGSISKDWSST